MQDNSVNILGYKISNQGIDLDVRRAMTYVLSKSIGKYMACANPHSLIVARTDVLFKNALNNADILLPDGIGILYAAKILNQKIKERVAGTEFFLAVSKKCNELNGKKVFFLGSTDYVLTKLIDKFSVEFPQIIVCGCYSPPFKESFSDHDNQVIVNLINESMADVLWVGMTAPKQEKWIYEHSEKLNVHFIGAIGAVFDFYAETKHRAPKWACDLGIEWLIRMFKEPKRLWRRNLFSSPQFLLEVFKQKLGFY